jgi:hypothetical protein
VQLALRRGTNRAVFVVGPLAFKFALHDVGARCNLYEADLYRRTTPKRREMLCPVIACAPLGLVLVTRAAMPLTDAEAIVLRATRGFPDWDYVPPDDECPFEPKASDWGWLDGRLVALDYSTPALAAS